MGIYGCGCGCEDGPQCLSVDHDGFRCYSVEGHVGDCEFETAREITREAFRWVTKQTQQ